jgi:transglutaminase-like putative cysteine protease
MTLSKAHRLAVFSIAAWGFIALLVTGDFSPMLVGLCCGLVVAAYLAPSGRSRFTLALWNVLTAFVFVGVLLIAKESLLDATVYFFMYLQIAKLFTADTSSDTLWIYIISFFQVIGTAVLTTSVAFAVVFLVYVIMMALSMALFTVHRELETSPQVARWSRYLQHATTRERQMRPARAVHAHDLRDRPFLDRRFLAGSGFISLLIVVTAIAFFMVIPRLSTQSLFRTDFGHQVNRDSASAFSETVEFGAFNKIHLDASVALYVEPLDKSQLEYVRLRAVALDNFDGQRWRRSISQLSGQPFARFSRQQVQFERRRFRMIQPPGITNFVFAPSFPDDLQIDLIPHVVFDAISNAAWLPRVPSRELSYTVMSRIHNLQDRKDPMVIYPADGGAPVEQGNAPGSQPAAGHAMMQPTVPRKPVQQREGAEALRNLVTAGRDLLHTSPGRRDAQTTGDQRRRADARFGPGYGTRSGNEAAGRQWPRDLYRMAPEVRSCYLQIPPKMDVARVGQLATGWARDATTPFEKARSIENHLRMDYRYSLESGPVPNGDFVEHFLFQTRQGHCEYFATSMVMMMRTMGIPARIVNGFYTTEWSALSRVFTVRQRDAHSWVEVYFDDYGWMTFDPTPPGGVGRTQTANAFVRWFQSLVDVARVRWYRHMIDYDYTNQIGIVRSVLRLAHRAGNALDQWHAVRSGEPSDGLGQVARSVGVVVVALAFVALCTALVHAALTVRRRSRAGGVARSWRSQSRFYAELLRQLKRVGFVRYRSETPREFACRVARTPGLELVDPVTESYYGERYASASLSPEELSAVEALLKAVKSR